MSRSGAAVLVLEVAATAAVQSTGLAGPIPFGAAVLVIVLSALCLLRVGGRPSLGHRLQDFVSDRRAEAPPEHHQEGSAEYEQDSLECYARSFGPAVWKRVRRLRQQGCIGRHEERRLTHPESLHDLEVVAERLIQLECRSHRRR